MHALKLSTRFSGMFVLLFTAMFLWQGCQQTDQAYVGIKGATDPDKVKLKKSLKWLNPQPNIRPVSANDMVIYLRAKDSSGSGIDLYDAVRDEVERLGYRVTRNIDEARFTFNADIRHFGEMSDKEYDALVGGAALGGLTGAVVGHNVGDNRDAGAVIGAGVGALLGNVVSNRNKMRRITLVTDITIGERVDSGVSTRRRGEGSSSSSHSGGFNVGSGAETGRSSASVSETQSVELKEDFLYHQNRATVAAEKLNLTLAEAEPVLVSTLSRAVANTLP